MVTFQSGTCQRSLISDISGMFYEATSFTFNSDISKWGVSRVTGMNGVFYEATSFNGDISKWDVSAVINMNNMFMGATSFKQKLCGAAWIHSKASKNLMFEGSPGSISRTVCTLDITTTALFSPRSKSQLKSAFEACLKLSSARNCSKSAWANRGLGRVEGGGYESHVY